MALLLAAPDAFAAQQQINSPGPLTSIVLTDDLGCQVAHSGDKHGEFFNEGATPGNCGTFVRAGGATYGPLFDNDQGPEVSPYAKVSQSAVTGAGTSANPFRVITSVSIPSPSLTITQMDTYIAGLESYRTDIGIRNNSGGAVALTLYHAGDCYIQNDDFGRGWFNSVTGGIYCTRNANNFPPARLLGFTPGSPGSNYQEGHYQDLWPRVSLGGPFTNSCACTTLDDNAAGLSWPVTLPAGGTATRSLSSVFSPSGDPSGNGRPATPVAGKFFRAAPAGGKVYFKCRGDSKQRRLAERTNLKVGCTIDTRRGRMRMTSAANGSSTKTKSALFFTGQFQVKEKRSSRVLTQLVLKGKLAGCGHARASGNVSAARRRGRRLWGKGKGRYRTKGRRSSATVRGTTWLVYDRCDGSTYTKSRSGTVVVRDFIKHKNVRLKSGQAYLAHPRRRR